MKNVVFKNVFRNGGFGEGHRVRNFSGGPTGVFSVTFVVRRRDLNLLGSLLGSFLKGVGSGYGCLVHCLANISRVFDPFLTVVRRWPSQNLNVFHGGPTVSHGGPRWSLTIKGGKYILLYCTAGHRQNTRTTVGPP